MFQIGLAMCNAMIDERKKKQYKLSELHSDFLTNTTTIRIFKSTSPHFDYKIDNNAFGFFNRQHRF